MKRQLMLWLGVLILLSSSLAACVPATPAVAPAPPPAEKAPGGYRIAVVVKNLGNPFFEAVDQGAKEAAKELGDEIIFQGPATPTAEGQIEIIDALIAQKVDAIAISANDPDALVPVAKKAMDAGIVVISFDSGIAPAGRQLHVSQADMEAIGRVEVQMIAEQINYEGQIAILSAAATMTNQNIWIEWMKEELKDPKYAKMELVTIVYGDDLREKSYNEAQGLFKSYPDLKGIISPTTVGIAATARALQDAGLCGKIKLTGLGLPSEMAEYVRNGCVEEFALWNPIDLGYLTAYTAHHLLAGTISGKPGETFAAGRLGQYTVQVEGDDIFVLLGPPFRFNKDNIDKWAQVY